MSIRPLDMQVVIQKSDHYTKEFNNNNQNENHQQDLSLETQKQVLHDQHQVLSTEPSINNRIDRDGSNNPKGRGHLSKRGKKVKNQDGDANMPHEGDKGSYIDIII